MSTAPSGPIDQVVLTRVNIEMPNVPDPSARLRPDWLDERFVRFEEWCRRSMVAARKITPDITWLVLFDAATPEPYLERARALSVDCFELVLVTGVVSVDDLAEMVRSRCRHERVVTTRFDTDDAVRPDFFALVRHAAEQCEGTRPISLPLGLQVVGDRILWRPYLQSPFISVVEPVATCRTIHQYAHHTLLGAGRVKYVWRPHAWV